MTVTAPPRPHRPSDPVTHGEFDALVEALIEEARRRGQRRRRRNAAVVTLVTLVGVAVFALLGRSAQSQTASPALSARLNSAAQTVPSQIAFIREPPHAGYAGVLWVMNPDGSGQRSLAPAFPDALVADGRRSPSRPSSSSRIIDERHLRHECRRQRAARPAAMPGRFSAWSPDGRRIAFLSSGIRVVNADGSGLRRLTARGSGHSRMVSRRAEDRVRQSA